MTINDILYHYGIKRRSGRYPYGSGDRPFQGESAQAMRKQKLIRDVFGIHISKSEAVSKNAIDPNKRILLKKGDKVQHITGVDMNRINSGQLYVTADQYDDLLYKLFLGSQLTNKGFSPKIAKIELKESLQAPSANEQRKIYDDIMDTKSEVVKRSIAQWMVEKGKVSSIDDAIQIIDQKNKDQVYLDFMNSLERATPAQKIFYDSLREAGFNAVLDEHDRVGSWMQGKYPLIIMDALATLSDVQVSDISNRDLTKYLEEWLKSYS